MKKDTMEVINMIRIEGEYDEEYVELNSLPLEKRIEISRSLNKKSLEAIGFVPIQIKENN